MAPSHPVFRHFLVFLVGVVVGVPSDPLKVKLLTGDLRTAQPNRWVEWVVAPWFS